MMSRKSTGLLVAAAVLAVYRPSDDLVWAEKLEQFSANQLLGIEFR